jgi:hypothetical protein
MRGNGFVEMFPLSQHLIIICLLFTTNYADAQNTPENAHNTLRHGSTCERGFRKSHGKCLPIKVPHNGKLNALANDWVCESGFFRVGSQCIQLRLNDGREFNY